MGMFDNLHCDVPLPLTKEVKAAFKNNLSTIRTFQTKDLDCTMSTYKIGKTGQLFFEKVEGEHVRIMTEAEEKKARKKNIS